VEGRSRDEKPSRICYDPRMHLPRALRSSLQIAKLGGQLEAAELLRPA